MTRLRCYLSVYHEKMYADAGHAEIDMTEVDLQGAVTKTTVTESDVASSPNDTTAEIKEFIVSSSSFILEHCFDPTQKTRMTSGGIPMRMVTYALEGLGLAEACQLFEGLFGDAEGGVKER